MAYKETEIKAFLKTHSEKTEQWVLDARASNTTLKALVTGEGFNVELINRIEHIESSKRAEARKKYAKDIRDLFSRVMKKRQNVFDANGGSINNLIKNKSIKEQFAERLSNFKANKSLYQYLSGLYFNLTDIDPNGCIMLEYKNEGKDENKTDILNLYPSYKSIHDIRFYKSRGQLVDYIVFEPKVNEETGYKIWRIVDDAKDYTFFEISGTFTEVPDKTFKHPFGKVPVMILSETCVLGTELRLSPLNQVLELAKDYARDKSVLTIYKFQNGIPFHWRYGSVCKSCNGLGKTGEQKCKGCDGKGHPTRGDVTDMQIIPLPKDGQPSLGDKIMGYSSPDLETWKQYKEDLRDMEMVIDDTIWGTDKTHQSDHSNETATGRFIDVQPIANTLNDYSNVAEYVYNTMALWVLNFTDQTKDKNEILYQRSFGRRYIIESPDVLLEKYGKAKEKGENNTILDKLLEEFILSKYKSDQVMQERMLKKSKVEPYLHLSIKDVHDIYGKVESNKKVLFQKFWQEAKTDKTAEQLTEDFNTYFNNNNSIKDESSKESEITH